jgi:hypothetical protein
MTRAQAGDVLDRAVAILLLEPVARRPAKGFHRRLDDLLDTLDRSAFSGRHTDWAMRDVWKQRKSGMDWKRLVRRHSGGDESTVLAAHLRDPEELARTAYRNIQLTYRWAYIAGRFSRTHHFRFYRGLLKEIRKPGNLQKKEIRVPSDCLTQVEMGRWPQAFRWK